MCVLCKEELTVSVSILQPIHRECAMRAGLGGIGHHIDHEYFCKQKGDPDAGLPYRLSALLVATYVRYVGPEKAAQSAVNVND